MIFCVYVPVSVDMWHRYIPGARAWVGIVSACVPASYRIALWYRGIPATFIKSIRTSFGAERLNVSRNLSSLYDTFISDSVLSVSTIAEVPMLSMVGGRPYIFTSLNEMLYFIEENMAPL